MRIHEGIQLWKHDWCVAGKLFLGNFCSKVMMLVVLMMTALTNTFAYDQWHLSAADIETGKAYWISFVSADHKNLSTEPTSVTKANGYSNDYSTTKLSIQQHDFTDLRQQVYFEPSPTAGQYYMYTKAADGTKTYMRKNPSNNWDTEIKTGEAENNNDFKFQVQNVAGTDYVRLKVMSKDWLVANRGIMDGGPVFCDNTNRYMALWQIMPADPLGYLKAELDRVKDLVDNATVGTDHNTVKAQSYIDALQTAYNSSSATYDDLKNTSELTTTQLSSLQTAWETVYDARNTFLQTAYNPIDVSKQYVVTNKHGEVMTRNTTNNGQAQVIERPTTIGNNQLMVFAQDANGNYTLRSNAATNSYLQTSTNKWANNQVGQLAEVNARWSTDNNRRQFYLHHFTNDYVGIYFNTIGHKANFTNESYLDYGIMDQTNGMYNLRAEHPDGIDNPTAYWQLEEFGGNFVMHIINLNNEEALRFTYSVMKSEYDQPVSLPVRMRNDAMVESYTYYKDAACTQPVSKWQDVVDASATEVWVKYTLKANPGLKFDSSYDYSLRIDSNTPRYLKGDSSGNITTDATTLNVPADYTDAYRWKLTATENDPYDVTITPKLATSNMLSIASSAVGTSANDISVATTTSTDGKVTKWIIVNGNDGYYRLLAAGPDDNYRYVIYNNNGTLNVSSSDKADTFTDGVNNNAVQMKVTPLIPVTYKVIRNDGSEFCSVVGNAPGHLDLPDYLKSPLAQDYRYYSSLEDAMADAFAVDATALDAARTRVVTGWAEAAATYYVRYSYNAGNGALEGGKSLLLNGEASYHLSGYSNSNTTNFIYWNSAANAWTANASTNNSRAANLGTGNPANSTNNYEWFFTGSDPYAITIRNLDMMSNNTIEGQYFLSCVVTDASAWPYLYNDNDRSKVTVPSWAYLNGGCLIGVVNGGEGKYRYFNNNNANTVIGDLNAGYLASVAPVVIRFTKDLQTFTYHIIDLRGYEAVSATASSDPSDNTMRVPTEIYSPLVGTYHYYSLDDFDTTTDGDSKTVYTLKSGATELTALQSDIYVTYTMPESTDANYRDLGGRGETEGVAKTFSSKTFTSGTKDYVLFYNNSVEVFNQEKEDYPGYGNYKATYPYINGAGGFYLYGTQKYDETITASSSTKTRYKWKFEGGDPYDVRVVSSSNKDKAVYHGKSTSYFSYFCTYHDETLNEDVTTTTQLDRSEVPDGNGGTESKAEYNPTRYMLIGANLDAITLKTRELIGNSQHTVSIYQHLWKSYYELSAENRAKGTTKDSLMSLGVPESSIHRLDIDNDWFNINNAKLIAEDYTEDSKTTKGILNGISGRTGFESGDDEKLQHWFTSINMGTTFQINRPSNPPVLHLLDKHGWQITQINMYNTDESKAAIRRFYSPMVKEYIWYRSGETDETQFRRTNGYYHFPAPSNPQEVGRTKDLTSDWSFINFDNDATYLDTLKNVNGTDSIKDGQVVTVERMVSSDYYVIYTVKDEYAKVDANNYVLPLFLFEENKKLAENSSTAISFNEASTNYYAHTTAAEIAENMLSKNPSENQLWKVRCNPDIDYECGYPRDGTQLIYYGASDDFDPYNIQFVSYAQDKASEANKFATVSYTGSELDAVVDVTAPLSLMNGDPDRANPKNYFDPTYPRYNLSGTTFMYVQGSSGLPEIISRFSQTYAFCNESNQLKLQLKSSNNAKQQARLTPVNNYKLSIKEAGSSTWDVENVDCYAVAGHDIELKKYKREFCDYTFYSTRYDTAPEFRAEDVITKNALTGGNIYGIYTFNQTAAGIRFFPTVEALLNDANQGTAWQFLQMGVGLQPETTFSYGNNLGMYFGSSTGGNDNASASERDMLKPGEKTFLVTDGSRSLHFLQRSGGMQAPVSDPTTGEVTQLPTTDDENVNAQVGKHYIASLNRSANVDLLSPRNDFRRIAETFKDGNDANYREGRWLWGFVGTPYSFQIVNKETAATKRLTVKRTWTEDGDIKTYTGYKGNPQLTTHFGDAADAADYGSLWSLGNGYTDEADQNTFQLKLVDADNCVAMQNYNNPTLGLHRSDVTSDIDRKHRSLKAYPWNWSANKYKPVKVKVYQDAVADGNLVKTFTYGVADRAFMAGDVIDGTNDHYLLRHTMEDGNPVTAETTDEYGVTIPYDDHKLNLPYDILRKFCDYFVDQDGDGTADSYTVTDSDEEQTINLVFTVQTGDLIPKFIKESDLATFKTLSNSQTFKDGNKKEDYYYFLDIWPDIRSHMYIYQKEYENIDGLGTKAKRWAFNYNVSRFRIGDVNAMKWYFVGNPYAVRLYNALSGMEDMNLGVNREGNHVTVFSDERAYDNVAIMHSDNDNRLNNGGKFCWEMVDGPRQENGSYYEDNNSLVTYRLDKIKDNGFSLRYLGDSDDVSEANGSGGTYHYLSLNYNGTKYGSGELNTITGSPLYNLKSNDLDPRGNQLLNTQLYFPSARHASATNGNLCTVFPVARVYLTVYDHEDTGTKVTDYELSEHYGVTDRFSGVPENLKRQFCNYTWLSTDEKPNGSNNLLNGDYMELNSSEMHLYATYQETSDSPFSLLDENNQPVLKRADSFGQSPWYNLKVGNRWALFDSNLQGLNGGKLNNSELAFNFGNNLSDEGNKIFKKGMHWALIGDPYNFTLKSRRDRIRATTDGTTINYDLSSDGNYQYDEAYIGKHEVTYNDNSKGIEPYLTDKSSAIYWTLLHNATAHERPELSTDYFLSESETRRSSTQETPAPRNGMRKMPANYIIKSQPQTLNFYQNNGTKRVNGGNYYAVGSTVTLTAIDNAGAQNDTFDAIVNVYNKLNELVATTGWTELARNNATWSSELPVDVKRWGCTYHFWGDETMTKYPFQNYQQKIDASGNLVSQTIDQETGAITNNGEGEYLIPDGGTVYVNYDYDESLYSSENEYRWVNMLFNWDSKRQYWPLVEEQVPWYTTEDWTWDEVNNQYVERASEELKQTKEIYHNGKLKYSQTKEGWISSPVTTENGYSVENAYAHQREQTANRDQKWALIGDPYRFILYNYQRRVDAAGQSKNAYYLVYNDTTNIIQNVDLSAITIEQKANYQGLYWTWKTDGTTYQYGRPEGNPTAAQMADDDANHHWETVAYERTGLPESYYKDKTDRTKLESGYLAVCDMNATSLYQTTGTLVGAVQKYATFNPETVTTTNTGNTKSYTKGCKNKYLGYWPKPGYSSGTTPQIDYQATEFTSHGWKALYRTNGNSTDTNDDGIYDNGTYEGCYIGPTPEPETTVVTKEYHQTITDNEATSQTLVTVGGQTTNASELITGGAKRFLVVPMAQKAASVTFHLDPSSHPASKRNWTTHPVWDYTTNNYGVDNTVALPWMMRRQYCDYTYYLVESGTNNPTAYEGKVDDLTHVEGQHSDTHRLTAEQRAANTYTDFWSGGTQLTTNEYGDVVIPETWDGKHVYIRVTYQPTADFITSENTGSTESEKAGTIHWLNIVNQEKGNMLQYTRMKGAMGDNKDVGADATNDYLWAVEGDPYGFVLHNRYADHGFDGTANEDWTAKVLRPSKMNSNENYNYTTENNENFAGGLQSGLNFAKVADANTACGIMGAASDNNSVFEAMTGNYDGAMLLHPVAAPVNVRNQNGYKYYSGFLFNATNQWPVQLNYLEDWEVMRNVFANWRLQKPTKEQLLPYYNRAGYVGGLKPGVATAYAELFGKLSNGSANDEEFNTAWALVHNPANLVAFTDGYYRLKAYSDNTLVGGQYVSGYLHKLEKDNNTPLHIFEKAGTATTIDKLDSYIGNEWAADVANKNLLEVMNPEYDPSSVFRITRDETGYLRMETQGMVVSDNMLADKPDNVENETEAMRFEVQDIGQTAFQIRTKTNTTGDDAEKSYLSYNPSTMKYGLNANANELSIAEGHVNDDETAKTHDTKWLLEPVGTAADNVNAAGVTYRRPLKVKVNNASGNSYASLCLPFNWSTSEGMTASTGVIDGQVGGSSGTLTHYHGTFTMQPIEGGKVKANQPVIIKIATTAVTNGCVEINLDEEVPTPAEEDPIIKGLCLTQEIELTQEDENQKKKVFSFGGVANGNPKFMLNAVKDYTNAKNNLFMPHHKMYLLLTNDQIDAASKGLPIPVDYDIEEPIATGIKDATAQGSKQDGVIYDLLGRKVERITRPGVYIRNGKKFVVKKGEY